MGLHEIIASAFLNLGRRNDNTRSVTTGGRMVNITKLEEAHERLLAAKDEHLKYIKSSCYNLTNEKDTQLVHLKNELQGIELRHSQLQGYVFAGIVSVTSMILVLLLVLAMIVWIYEQGKKKAVADLSKQDGTLLEKDSQIDELKDELQNRIQLAEKLQAHIATQTGIVDEKNNQIGKLESLLCEEREKVATLQDRISHMEGLLEEKKRYYEMLQADLDRTKQVMTSAALPAQQQLQPQLPVVFTFPGIHPSLTTSTSISSMKENQ